MPLALADMFARVIDPRKAKGKIHDLVPILSLAVVAELPAVHTRQPAAAQVLAHLQSAFPHADCPIAAFQHATRSFFV